MSRPKIDLGDQPGEYKPRAGVGYAGRYGVKKSKRPQPAFFKAEKPKAAPAAVAMEYLAHIKNMLGME